MIEIDGSYGEGGGQILRSAIALSAVTGKGVRITKIRANRPNPGLSHQHITAIKSVARICNAEVKGLVKGSRIVEFLPDEIKGGKFRFDVGTAGSVTLVLQACFLPSIFAKHSITLQITGGTDVKWSPPIDYFSNVFLRLLNRIGIDSNCTLIRRGYYPKGGGEIEVEIEPARELKSLCLKERGELKGIQGVVHASNLPEHIPKRIKYSVLKKFLGYEVELREGTEKALSAGVGIVLWAEFENTVLGANCLGERGVPAEKVGESVSDDLLRLLNTKATLDNYAVDQILPYLPFCRESSEFLCLELSEHAKTNIWVIRQFVDAEFKIDEFGGLRRLRVEP